MKETTNEEVRKLIEEFKEDKYFNDALEYNKSHSFFEIMSSVWERESSDFIAWLLDPVESHGLEESIFQYMIDECKNSHSKLRSINSNILDEDFDRKVLNNFYIEVEVAKKLKNTNKILDIILVNPVDEIIVIIENKYGAAEGKGQLENYIKICKEHYSNDYRIVPIYIDPILDDSEIKNENKSWNYLGYNWICSAIESNINSTTKESKVILNDIILEIRGDYGEDSRFKKSVKAINKLSEYHRSVSLIYHEQKKSNFKRFRNEPDILLFMKRNAVVLDRIYDTNQYHSASIEIEKNFSRNENLKDYIFDHDFSSKGVAFTSKEVNENSEGDTWAIDINFYHCKKKKTYEVSMYVDSSIIKNKKILENIIEDIGGQSIEKTKKTTIYLKNQMTNMILIGS